VHALSRKVQIHQKQQTSNAHQQPIQNMGFYQFVLLVVGDIEILQVSSLYRNEYAMKEAFVEWMNSDKPFGDEFGVLWPEPDVQEVFLTRTRDYCCVATLQFNHVKIIS